MKKAELNLPARASFDGRFAVFTQTLFLVTWTWKAGLGACKCVFSPTTVFLLLTTADSTISQRPAVQPATQQHKRRGRFVRGLWVKRRQRSGTCRAGEALGRAGRAGRASWQGRGGRRVRPSGGRGSRQVPDEAAAASQGKATCIPLRPLLLAGHEIPASTAAKGKVPKACTGARTASSFQCTLVVPDLGLCLCREGT